MSLKKIGKLLISLGILLLIYGLVMDTSVSTDHGRVVNIGLANDRLMFILIGGFTFVGGVILYAVFKAKQTKQDELDEQVERESQRAYRKVLLRDAVEFIVKSTKIIFRPFAKDFMFHRLGHALGIAFLVTYIARNALQIHSVIELLFYAITIALIFRPLDHFKAISQGWLLASIASPIIILLALLRSIVLWGESFADIEWTIFFSLFLLPSIVFYLLSKRFSSKSLAPRGAINQIEKSTSDSF